LAVSDVAADPPGIPNSTANTHNLSRMRAPTASRALLSRTTRRQQTTKRTRNSMHARSTQADAAPQQDRCRAVRLPTTNTRRKARACGRVGLCSADTHHHDAPNRDNATCTSTASTPTSDGQRAAATSSRPESDVHSERKHSRCDATRSNRAHQMDAAAHQRANRAMAACNIARSLAAGARRDSIAIEQPQLLTQTRPSQATLCKEATELG
jgi:hypothetical protein